MEGVTCHPLKQIQNPKGDVFHVVKNSDLGSSSFGEAYFSFVCFKEIKGWKKHTSMISRLTVPVGKVKFVLFDDRRDSDSFGKFVEFKISPENYRLLIIPPGVWFAFSGLSKCANLVLNVASIEHDPSESVTKEIILFPYKW